jgi:hypothetical protein
MKAYLKPSTKTFLTNHQPPPTQALPTIIKTIEHPTFDNSPATQHPTNMPTAAGCSHNDRGASSTQTFKGASHQSTPRVPSLPQEHWDEEAEEDEATAEEEELIWVQQEIERLQYEQESIMRR